MLSMIGLTDNYVLTEHVKIKTISVKIKED